MTENIKPLAARFYIQINRRHVKKQESQNYMNQHVNITCKISRFCYGAVYGLR